jgi:hypothetical protein
LINYNAANNFGSYSSTLATLIYTVTNFQSTASRLDFEKDPDSPYYQDKNGNL